MWKACLIIALAQPACPAHAASARAVFAGHDPEKRLANTTIRLITRIQAGNGRYRIYYLDFANPLSKHGQQRIAIIRNGHRFMGAMTCDVEPQEIRWNLRHVWVDPRRFGGGPVAIKFYPRHIVVPPHFCHGDDSLLHSI